MRFDVRGHEEPAPGMLRLLLPSNQHHCRAASLSLLLLMNYFLKMYFPLTYSVYRVSHMAVVGPNSGLVRASREAWGEG